MLKKKQQTEVIQSKFWCYTWYDIDIDPADVIPKDTIGFHIYQLELCPKTEREHYQGYVVFNGNWRLKRLKKLISNTAHWECRVGSHEEATAYCEKEESRYIDPRIGCEVMYRWGSYKKYLSKQGERIDLYRAYESVMNQHSTIDIIHQDPSTFIKFHRGISVMKGYLSIKRNWKPDVLIYWGEPGSGKTRKASDDNPVAYWKSSNSKWWDSYDGESCVIIDDFRFDWKDWSESYMLQLCDRYPMKVEAKGSSNEFLAKKIIFTSNHHPSEWCNWIWDTCPMKRRVTSIVHFRKGKEPKEEIITRNE